MNTIITSLVTDPLKLQPFTAPSLAFLQASNVEMIKALCRTAMGESRYAQTGTKGVAMSGVTFNNLVTIVYEGFIFYNGELYKFDGGNFSAYSNIPVVVADTSYSGSPIEFTDGSLNNVLQVRKLKIQDGISGSGLFDLKDILYCPDLDNKTQVFCTNTTTASATPVGITGATYTTPKGLSGQTRNFKIRISGEMQAYILNGSAEGGNLRIRNNTTNTTLATAQPQITGAATMVGGPINMHSSLEYLYPNVPPNTQLVATIEVTGTNIQNATFNNPIFIVEEY